MRLSALKRSTLLYKCGTECGKITDVWQFAFGVPSSTFNIFDQALLRRLLGWLFSKVGREPELPRRHNAQEGEDRAGREHGALVVGDPVDVEAHQRGAGDEVHGHAEPVHDPGAVRLRDDLALGVGHGREVHADGDLQEEEGEEGDDGVCWWGARSGNISVKSSQTEQWATLL